MKKASKKNKSKLLITAKSDPIDLRIYFNGIIHLYVPKKQVISFQSWLTNETDLKIEIYTTTGSILLEYDTVEKWKSVLELLDKNI